MSLPVNTTRTRSHFSASRVIAPKRKDRFRRHLNQTCARNASTYGQNPRYWVNYNLCAFNLAYFGIPFLEHRNVFRLFKIGDVLRISGETTLFSQRCTYTHEDCFRRYRHSREEKYSQKHLAKKKVCLCLQATCAARSQRTSSESHVRA